MSNSKPKLSPARNGAAYPTLRDVGLDRRFLFASVGAAALAVGLSCSTAGEPPYHPWPEDASRDAGAEVFTGADASGIVAPKDGGVEGGDS